MLKLACSLSILMASFNELFNDILTADKNSSRKTAREVRKLIYSFSEVDKYKLITSIIDNAPIEYAKIKEDWRQENFVIAISVMYFLHNKENQPDFLFPWLFKLLQHKNGNIRHAAVRMFENESGPLTYHIRFPGEESTILKLSSESADSILFELYVNLNNLMADFWKPSFKKHKYISLLPTGVYKSIQLILSHLEDNCGREYLEHLMKQNFMSGYITPLRD